MFSSNSAVQNFSITSQAKPNNSLAWGITETRSAQNHQLPANANAITF
jgi:hypothetical protein